MLIIGDIHGDFDGYAALCQSHPDEPTIQLGDFGIFSSQDEPVIVGNNYFFRGNHDNPSECRKYANYLGEYGYVTKTGVPFFFVSGAWSIDHLQRTEGVDWWRDEELSLPELYDCLELYAQTKPRLMITHDCPTSIQKFLHGSPIPTRTGQALQAMLEAHKPELWVFGHHHTSWRKKIYGTTFRCVASNCYIQVNK